MMKYRDCARMSIETSQECSLALLKKKKMGKKALKNAYILT